MEELMNEVEYRKKLTKMILRRLISCDREMELYAVLANISEVVIKELLEEDKGDGEYGKTKQRRQD
ncbi:MAG: hypothetical protein IKZ43_07445 [Acidaminococcaceae bacterium]|nr:hypothetical protein [Acidaminococcaceae bacterium]